MKLLTTTIFLCISIVAFSQKGTIEGIVLDQQKGEPIIGANVFIEGTTNGSSTGLDGDFQFQIEPGIYTLVASFIGYSNFKVTYLEIKPGETVNLTIQLQTSDVQLQEVVVTAKADKASETLLLLERKKAVLITQTIGAQELSRKGVSNVETAVTKVTGVSKQEGVKNVFVRGLGDRYNSTSLNGLPLPSEDPEYKNISLDFFSTDIISSVDINKIFNSSILGDVDGANINIVSKELYEEEEFSVSLSSGLNSNTIETEFLRPNNLGNGMRDEAPITNLNLYNFNNNFKPYASNLPLNSSFTVTGGKRFKIGSKNLDAFVVASMDNSFTYQEGVARSSVNANGGIGRDFYNKAYNYDASQILLGNFRYKINENINLFYNSLYIHSNTQKVEEYYSRGMIANLSETGADNVFIRRQQVNDNKLLVNQLLADIRLMDRLSLDLSGSYNIVKGSEPDRRTNTFLNEKGTDQHRVAIGSAALNHRFFSALEENDINAEAKLIYKFHNDENSNSKIELGYALRNTTRTFASTQYNFDFPTQVNVDINNPDASLFNQQGIDEEKFILVTSRGRNAENPNSYIPDSYDGSRTIHGLLVNATYDLSEELTIGAGIRFEMLNQEVTWDFSQDQRRNNLPGDNTTILNPNYLLPSVNVRYAMTDSNIIRFAASKSYTFPQYKEVSPFFYEDVNFSSFGNPNLRPAENYNLDLRFEKYLSRNSIFAVTAFYKRIQNAINRVLVNSAASELSYVNTGNADVTGVEVEIQKGLWEMSSGDLIRALSIGANGSYLYSSQELRDVEWDKLTVDFTNTSSQLEGASPLLLNADLTYSSESKNSGFRASLIGGYFHDRVFTLGTRGRSNIVENAVPTLDLITSFKFNNHFNIDLKAKNLLNPDYRLTQEIGEGSEVEIDSFNKGRVFSFGLTYKF